MTTTGRCATCKWWEPPKSDDSHGECFLINEDTDDLPNGAFIQERWVGEHHIADRLGTKPTFGCVLHEEKGI